MTRLDIRDASLLEYLPESIKSDPEIVAISKALDVELLDVGEHMVDAVILPRLADASEEVINEIAWACRFNELQLWDTATPDGKRAMLDQFLAVRKKSGTKFAVRRVFGLLGLDGVVVEWFEEGADPFTYRLRIFCDDTGITTLQLVQVREFARRFSPARARLSELAVESSQEGPLAMGSVLTIGRHVTIEYGGP